MNTFIVEAENYKTLQTENVDISEYDYYRLFLTSYV